MVFVDTSAWYAAFVPADRDHMRAQEWLVRNKGVLVTTDYICDELLTLLKARREYQRALCIGESLLAGRIARLEWVVPADVQAAWRTYSRFRDKEWSFTDCVSIAVMKRLGIDQAFAFDTHFRQLSEVTVHPA